MFANSYRYHIILSGMLAAGTIIFPYLRHSIANGLTFRSLPQIRTIIGRGFYALGRIRVALNILSAGDPSSAQSRSLLWSRCHFFGELLHSSAWVRELVMLRSEP